jgi:hypothetical protein
MATTTKDRSSSGETRSRNSGRAERGRSSGGSGDRTERGRSGGSSADTKAPAPNATAEERKFIEKNSAKLSKSTLRAKWIHGDERPDRNGQTLATRDTDVIRRWAEARGGQPATVGRRDGSRPRTLRFDFSSNGSSSRLEPVEWEEWLGTFRDRDLVFLYQEKRRDGSDSNFFRLDSPKREEG